MAGEAGKLVSLTPILSTDDMDRSVRFYGDVLGFACGVHSAAYSNLYRDEVRIVLAAPNEHVPWAGPSFTGQLYFELANADDVDVLWRELNGRADVIYPVDDFEYGMREFAIRDDNGYQLTFGARLPK